VSLFYQVELHKRDLALLEKIRMFYGNAGNIYVSANRNSARFVVSKLKDLSGVIVPHFNKYELYGNKNTNYQI
jgi:hypothetical protein